MDKFVIDILKSENINQELYYVAILDGSNSKTVNSFVNEIGRAFKFPSYYGKNLNALDECINDLEWIDKPNYFLIIKNYEDFLKDESLETRDHILSFFQRVAKEWASVPNYEGEEVHRHKADFKVKMI